MNNIRFSLVPLIIAILFCSACASEYLRSDTYRENEAGLKLDEESKILDTANHRAMLDVLARYRRALVKKDVGTIKSLVSNDYYENSGTTNTTADDYGAADLPSVFELLAKHTNDIKYDIVVKELHLDGDRGYIDYEFQYAYHYFVDGKPSWDAGIDVNRLSLSKADGSWKITSGL